MKYKWLLTLLTISFLVQQCAKQTSPTGGPKDETPPTLMQSSPAHQEVNFKGKEIKLTFDELIQLNNPREQLIITPGIGKKFETTARKNKVVLVLNSELQDSTTYSVNFRECVQDLNEKNPAVLKLAFSTGSYIDSLNVTGTVTDILSDKGANNYTVALTPASDTFNIFKHPASWIALTDKQGRFAIENLKPGKYFIYAFEDINKNLTVDSKSEKYGFKSDDIGLEGAVDSVKIQAFKLDASKLKLISSRPTFAYFNIRFSKSLVDFKLLSANTEERIYSTLESDLSTIKVYNTIPDFDSLQVRLQAQDSTYSKVDTLIYIKFPKKESTKDNFSSKVEFCNFYENKSMFSSSIVFSKPVTGFTADSMYIQVDSLTRITFNKDDYEWNELLTELSISKKIELKSEPPETGKDKKSPKKPQTKKYNQLMLSKGSVISIENDTAVHINSPLKTIKTEDYGMISSKIETKEEFILQLLDKSNKILEEIKNNKTHNFENIPAGNYSLRLLIDLNKNGKWDAGNYITKEQPEPIVFYNNPKGGKDIFLKANWQVGPLLISY